MAIVTGGGSGHLPVFVGYVGEGLLDGCAVMGALIAYACMRMGKAAEGKGCLARDDLLRMAAAAEAGIRTRGKASIGD